MYGKPELMVAAVFFLPALKEAAWALEVPLIAPAMTCVQAAPSHMDVSAPQIE
jgi:hypothetical protein